MVEVSFAMDMIKVLRRLLFSRKARQTPGRGPCETRCLGSSAWLLQIPGVLPPTLPYF